METYRYNLDRNGENYDNVRDGDGTGSSVGRSNGRGNARMRDDGKNSADSNGEEIGSVAYRRHVRIGIDVGGTFTKAVAIDSATGDIVSVSTVPTTHDARRGVSDGILDAFTRVVHDSGTALDDIDLVAHSTTQAINALLEGDTYPVGIVAMGVGPTKKDVIKRTRLDERSSILQSHKDSSGKNLHTYHEFLDTSHLITEQEVSGVIARMRDSGAKCIVATEMFGVDDPANEEFVAEQAAAAGLPCTASHEISGTYGLEIRTLTAAVNASIMPKTLQVADFVEGAMSEAGVTSPLLIMRGDGGVTSMSTFRSRPILTVLSGPAASVAGALLHLRVTNGIFIEVGGTSTNICIIKDGRPEIRYVTIRDHPTCIRSMDVRIVGVAGGSMVVVRKKRVHRVGPRSAHIAGLRYACYAEDASDIESGQLVMISPRPNDEPEYAAIRCSDGTIYAITNTCAANALGRIPSGDYSECGGGGGSEAAAKAALRKLGDAMGVSYSEAAMSVILTSAQEITKTVSRVLKEYKMEARATKVIGGGGGASVLVPEVAKNMGMTYEKAPHAEVISSIGVASSMLQEELEVAMSDPTPEMISAAHKDARTGLIKKGAVPESVRIDSRHISDKGILRITAIGSVAMEEASAGLHGTTAVGAGSGHGSGGQDGKGAAASPAAAAAPSGAGMLAAFGPDEALKRASEIMQVDAGLVNLEFESDHFVAMVGPATRRRLFGKNNRRRVLVLDRFGRSKLDVACGVIFHGDKHAVTERLDDYMKSKHSGIAPPVHLIDDVRMLDYSGLTSPSHVLSAVQDELAEDARAAIIIEA